MGTGNACAGHCIVNVTSEFVTNIAPTCVVDIFGGTRPMGSEEWRKRALMESYRYKGAGKACAGQSKAMLEDSLNWKPLVVCALANLGGTRPTGSAHVGRRNHGQATPEIYNSTETTGPIRPYTSHKGRKSFTLKNRASQGSAGYPIPTFRQVIVLVGSLETQVQLGLQTFN